MADPVFINSQIRARSTWWFTKFRNVNETQCYYTPLSPALFNQSPKDRGVYSNNKSLRHEPTDHYFLEYPVFDVPLETARDWSQHSYAMGPNEDNPEMEEHIASLINHADSLGKTPVMKFNSAVLRGTWLKEKFGGIHIYLDRDYESLRRSFDSMQVYGSLESYYESMGQINESVKYMELKFKEMEKTTSPKTTLVSKVFDIDKYTKANKDDKAFKVLKEIEEQFEAPIDKVVYFGYLLVYIDIEDIDNARKAIIEAEKLMNDFGEDVLQIVIYYGQARIYEVMSEYEKAIDSYVKVLELQPTGFDINRFIGRCYRKLNKLRKAEEYLLIALKDSPYNPENNYELALLYFDMGDTQKAIEYLKVANDIWKDADPEYKPAQKAKEKLVEIKAMS